MDLQDSVQRSLQTAQIRKDRKPGTCNLNMHYRIKDCANVYLGAAMN